LHLCNHTSRVELSSLANAVHRGTSLTLLNVTKGRKQAFILAFSKQKSDSTVKYITIIDVPGRPRIENAGLQEILTE
jgi:hypothetical protein